MSTFKNEVTGVIAPPPDDSDFLESENEQDDGQSFIDEQQDLKQHLSEDPIIQCLPQKLCK